MPGQKWATNNRRGYCEAEGTVHVSTQERSKGRVISAGALYNAVFLETGFSISAKLFDGIIEGADAARFEGTEEVLATERDAPAGSPRQGLGGLREGGCGAVDEEALRFVISKHPPTL